MNRLNAFLERHDIDAGRCIAVLLVVGALDRAYGTIFGIVELIVSSGPDGLIELGGVPFLYALVAVVEALLAVALWKHRPLARKVVVIWLWGLFALIACAPFFRPLFAAPVFAVAGLGLPSNRDWQSFVVPLSRLPWILFLLAALACPVTLAKFRRA